MNEDHIMLLGKLDKGLAVTESKVDNIAADVKLLLGSHNRAKGISYAVSAIVAFFVSVFTGKV